MRGAKRDTKGRPHPAAGPLPRSSYFVYTYAVTSAQSDISSNHGLIHIADAPPPRVPALFDFAPVNSLCSRAAR